MPPLSDLTKCTGGNKTIKMPEPADKCYFEVEGGKKKEKSEAFYLRLQGLQSHLVHCQTQC